MKNREHDVFHSFGSRLLKLLYPEENVCLCCRKELEPSDYRLMVCRTCTAELSLLAEEECREEVLFPISSPGELAYVHCAFPYKGAAKQLVYRLKYDHIRRAALPLAFAMAVLPAEEETLLACVPTTKRRKRMRGFNQAALLADRLSVIYGMPFNEKALFRTDDGESQTRLSVEARKRNLSGKMSALPVVKGKNVLLIDDVFTTGSTALEAARALTEAGAIKVGMLAACCAWHHDYPY